MIPAIAAAIAEWFPELNGRSIAVSEVEPFADKTNVPTLPIAVVALVAETGEQTRNGGGKINLTSDILVQFIFEPIKYNREDGSELPFFAFYDYEPIRDKLLEQTAKWRGPGNFGLSYTGLTVESTPFAVYIAFSFTAVKDWCQAAPVDECGNPVKEGHDLLILYNVCPASSKIPCCDCEPTPEPEDPCDFARLRNPFGREAQEAADDNEGG